MSGGWDWPPSSPAPARRSASGGTPGDVTPVSISYPEGDPGREDELISAIASHWNSPVHWIDVEQIPLLAGAESNAGQRDGPYAHTYEHWNRALAEGTRSLGARRGIRWERRRPALPDLRCVPVGPAAPRPRLGDGTAVAGKGRPRSRHLLRLGNRAGAARAAQAPGGTAARASIRGRLHEADAAVDSTRLRGASRASRS